MTNVVFRGKVTFSLFRPFFIIIHAINNRIAKANAKRYPQVAIFSFDHIGLLINLEGRYERDWLDLIQQFIFQDKKFDSEGNILDIGANIGNHSIFFAKYCKRVFAFEPNPRTYKLLEFNSFSANISHFNYGLSDENGTMKFKVNPSNIGGSKILPENGEPSGNNIIDVEVRRLDDIAEVANSRISLIKIDVEGHELRALRGASKTIERNEPIILFEQGQHEIHDGSSEVIDFLRSLGYRFLVIENRFHFGEAFYLKLFSLILRALLGYQKNIVEKNYFEKRFYDMIVAIKGQSASSDTG